MSKSKEARIGRLSSSWQSILLPLIAGFLHLQVFYYASTAVYRSFINPDSNTTTTITTSSEQFRNDCYLLDRAIFLAYMFDLLCCYLKVIPFSRCNTSKDIIGHHVPTLLLALPLAIPLWSSGSGSGGSDNIDWCSSLEVTSCAILDSNEATATATEATLAIRQYFITSYTMASGFAYISSLNEVFMCFQRVEMSLNGIPYFWDIPKYQYSYPKLFTSRLVIGIELWYKFIFFWFMSLVACKACCDFDKSLYDYIATIASNDGEQQEQQEQSIWKILLIIYTSPAVLRGALFRAFSVVSVMLFCIGSFRCSTVLSLDTSFSRTISVGFVCYHTLCIFESK